MEEHPPAQRGARGTGSPVNAAPDYTRMLRLHAARWTVVFMVLAGAWVLSVVVSLGLGNAVPVLVATALVAGAVCVCRIRYVQLRDADNEALIRALSRSLEDL